MQVLSLTAPGVQVFERTKLWRWRDRATINWLTPCGGIRRDSRGWRRWLRRIRRKRRRSWNEACARWGLKGAIVNSHTRGEYLDDQKFWPIFEAAEALGVPIYLHPTSLPPAMVQPFLERGLDGAIYGFAAETGLHILRIVLAGVFDRFPKLQMVAGHLGEGLPFWLFRIDFMHRAMVKAERYASVKKLNRQPSEYLRDNFHVTTSGMAWEPAILYAQCVLGADRVLYAMDYPYQFVPEEVQVTDGLPISGEDKQKLYQLNAERVFSLCN